MHDICKDQSSMIFVLLVDLFSTLLSEPVGQSSRVVADAGMADVVSRNDNPTLTGTWLDPNKLGEQAANSGSAPLSKIRQMRALAMQILFPSNPQVPMVAQIVSCRTLIKDKKCVVIPSQRVCAHPELRILNLRFFHEFCTTQLADEAEVFCNPAVLAILDYKWASYGKFLCELSCSLRMTSLFTSCGCMLS